MKKNTDDNTMNLFEYMNDNGIDNGSRIEVVKLDYVGSELMTWKELFSGFDKLYAITFSSSIGFVNELLDLFGYAEIIFGCEDVMSMGIKEIMAYQDTLIERIRGDKHGIKDKMIDRIKAGTAHFYVAEKIISHEKIYLLEGENSKKRVVMGSANMSYNAFGGKQRENISYMDGDTAFDYYMDVYESLKEDSVDEISKKALEYADLSENIDALPFSDTVKAKNIVAIETAKNEEVKFILDVNKKAERLAPHMPKPEKKSNKTLISADNITKLRRHLVDEKKKEQDLRSEYPQLMINVLENCANLNGEELNLNPDSDDVRNDVDLFLKYMNGYSKFHGDVAGLQLRYFEFANWFFCSPFMAVMRDMAARYEQNKLPYPGFGLLYPFCFWQDSMIRSAACSRTPGSFSAGPDICSVAPHRVHLSSPGTSVGAKSWPSAAESTVLRLRPHSSHSSTRHSGSVQVAGVSYAARKRWSQSDGISSRSARASSSRVLAALPAASETVTVT